MKLSDLSEEEKAAVQHLWANYPEKREASGDPNDPTLGDIEEWIVQNVGQPADFTFGDPVKRCDQTQYISLGKNFPFQNCYCANCGTELKKLEDDNFEMVCDCGENGQQYDFDLITFDPDEHIQRKLFKQVVNENLDDLDKAAIELGLDIENYPFRWMRAKKLALRMNKRDYEEENAFQLACRLFLKLGGEKPK